MGLISRKKMKLTLKVDREWKLGGRGDKWGTGLAIKLGKSQGGR